MRDFDIDEVVGAEAEQGSTVSARHASEVVEEVTVGFTPMSPGLTHLFTGTGDWGWEQLRDYVINQIESRRGAIPRDPAKEYGIFNSFAKRWGCKAGAIARYAFEVCDGTWMRQPISIGRFTKGSDPYFAAEIAKRLVES